MAWDDFSEFVTHFTKATPPITEYANKMSICSSGRLIAANPFGIAKSRSPNIDSQKTVCFSEVPLHCLSRIAKRRSRFGIGFTKEFAKSKGALPIWYVEKDSLQHHSVEQLMEESLASTAPEDSPIWKLTPFIDVPGNYPKGTYRFEWEREWRCVGDFFFKEDEPAFLIIPDESHIAARDFFRGAWNDGLGPYYDCPFIDSSWNADKIAHALKVCWPHDEP